MHDARAIRLTAYSALALVCSACFLQPPAGTYATPAPGGDPIQLTGVVRDFRSSHPDFGQTATTGHHVHCVGSVLGARGYPLGSGAGYRVIQQWHDVEDNTIMPYGDPGLPGGHFDLDVYDRLSNKPKSHIHEFDDKYDTTTIDIANDPILQWDSIVGHDYPNDIRIEFLNAHHGGGGTYRFDAAGTVTTGVTAAGFDTTFDPADFDELLVNLVSLDHMVRSHPKDARKDVANRDGAFRVQMFDTVSGNMIYEVCIYNHYDAKKGALKKPTLTTTPGLKTVDRCGNTVDDSAGSYGLAGKGLIRSPGSFSQWFRDVLGTNMSAVHAIELVPDVRGVYEYSTDEFYPIDGRLLSRDRIGRNEFFTYTLQATFTFEACRDYFFEFESNDDAWVYIDDRIVIDMGGIGNSQAQRVGLDRIGADGSAQLEDGREYSLKLFCAHRRSTSSSKFHVRTNIPLRTSDSIPMTTLAFD
ncbi:MAG: fibro-slime domain-containing protein [Planctomycetota bacterium]|jgi:fibro-slime domain-containing protein